MARTVYVTTELQGGGSGLDGIDGNNLVKGDMAFYINRGTTAPKHEGQVSGIYVASSRGSTVAWGSTEDAPNYIKPDSNGANWIWGLTQPLVPVFNTTGLAAVLPNYGVSLIRTPAPTVHQLKRPRKGVAKTIIFVSTSLVKIRLTTAAAGSLSTPTVRIGTSGSTCCVIAFTSRSATVPYLTKVQISLLGESTRLWRVTQLLPWSTNKLKFSSST